MEFLKTLGRRVCVIAGLFAVVCLSSSCAFIQLSEDLKKRSMTGDIHGRVINREGATSPLIIVVFDKSGRVVGYQRLASGTSYYAFNLTAGRIYDIVAFEDLNGDLKYEKSEPFAHWKNSEKARLVAADEIIANLNFIQTAELPLSRIIDINKLDPSLGSKFIVATGKIVDLDNELFSPECARKGLWTPLAFLNEYGLGVYFLEKYDPRKIPVLFVNGIGGSPREWKSFTSRIDRNRYQPWFYFYPSGARIQNAGKALNTIVEQLLAQYNFDSMCVIAHSMGGLVAKEFIKRSLYENGSEFIKVFITISTPWRGDKDAEWSKGAPAVIPCWRDLRPSSDFIKNSSSSDIGSKIPYYLLFSYRGDRKPFRLNNDNVVYLSSELSLDMQKRAKKVYGFNSNHSTILSSVDVIDICADILAEYAGK